MSHRLASCLLATSALALGGCTSMSPGTRLATLAPGGGDESAVIVLPATGAEAALQVGCYERQFLSSRPVGLTPGSREPGMAEKLGFGGGIESMKLTCS